MSISKKTLDTKQKPQSQAFIDAARELGCDDDPEHFDEMLKKVARHKHVVPSPEEAKPNSNDEKESE